MNRLGLTTLFAFLLVCLIAPISFATVSCRIEVIDADNGWPVPLVQLRTVNSLHFVTDNAGAIAIDAPELMGRETFIHAQGHGYTIPTDGLGYSGVRINPKPDETIRIKIKREIIAKRLGRIAGTGLFAEPQKLGD